MKLTWLSPSISTLSESISDQKRDNFVEKLQLQSFPPQQLSMTESLMSTKLHEKLAAPYQVDAMTKTNEIQMQDTIKKMYHTAKESYFQKFEPNDSTSILGSSILENRTSQPNDSTIILGSSLLENLTSQPNDSTSILESSLLENRTSQPNDSTIILGSSLLENRTSQQLQDAASIKCDNENGVHSSSNLPIEYQQLNHQPDGEHIMLDSSSFKVVDKVSLF